MDDLALLEIGRLAEENPPSWQGMELAVGVFHGAIRQLLGNSANTEEMIEAGKLELLHAGFGEYDNPCVDFEEIAAKIYRAMVSAARDAIYLQAQHPPGDI
jgi:hypothetical protein